MVKSLKITAKPSTNVELSNLFTSIKRKISNVNTIRRKITEASKLNLSQKNEIGDTPLIVAATEGSLEVVTALLEAGANPDIKGYEDGTALDWAATKGRTEIVRKLAEHGASMTRNFDLWIKNFDEENQKRLEKAFAEGEALYDKKLASGAGAADSAGGGRTRRPRIYNSSLHKLPKRHRLRTRRRHANRRSKRNRH